MTFKQRFKKYWKINLIFTIISLVVGAGIFLAVFFTNDHTYITASNACFVSAGVLIFFGLLCWIAKEGFFDFVSYGFLQFGHMLFNRKEPTKYDDFPGYKVDKKEKRSSSPDYFLGIILIGTLSLIGAIVFSIINNTNLPTN